VEVPSHARDVAVRVGVARGPTLGIEIYVPGHAAGGRLIELATTARRAASNGADEVARLARTLQRFGFEVARTTPGSTFLTTRLLAGFLAPLVSFIERGGEPSVIVATLRDAGFVRSPRELLASLDPRSLADAIGEACDRPRAERVLALTVLAGPARPTIGSIPSSWTACASRSSRPRTQHARRGWLRIRAPSIWSHARSSIFPRHLVSLCTWLKRDRVARAVAQPGVRSLVPAAACETATAFAAEGREFYR
jgi:hypothetical protein